nr:putative ORF1 [Marmot picobirnavirus]
MTRNQIARMEALEVARHNRIMERDQREQNERVAAETNRHNVFTEAETQRANLAREDLTSVANQTAILNANETIRSNQARELETNRHNIVAESETSEHNRAQEAIGRNNAMAALRQAEVAAVNANINKQRADTADYEAGIRANQQVLDVGINNQVNALRQQQIRESAARQRLLETQRVTQSIDTGVKAADTISKLGSQIAKLFVYGG